MIGFNVKFLITTLSQVFCLAAPTPVTNGVVTMVAETEEDILENNNNSKKRSLEDIPGSCSNKVTTAGRLEFESKSTVASSTMSPVVSCMSAPEWVVSPLPPT